MAAVAVVPAVANIKPYDTKEPFGALFFMCTVFCKGMKNTCGAIQCKGKIVSDKGKKRDKGENIGIDIYEKDRDERASE